MEYVPVRMVRPDMANLPQHPLPPGYTTRFYRPGDRDAWLRIWRRAEKLTTITDDMFDSLAAGDFDGMARRCHFLVSPEGQDVGTATAWYEPAFQGKPWGRVHWVAIVPAHQGKGLSRGLMTVTMNRLRGLGHRRAMLMTQTPRIAAIRTYLHFGFVPDPTADRAVYAWGLVGEAIDHPALREYKAPATAGRLR
jgi:GNAT superfamily N-acetyltransferase